MDIEQEVKEFKNVRYQEECDKELLKVPEKYREKVKAYAYRQGHSSGWSEVYHYTLDLVDIFKN